MIHDFLSRVLMHVVFFQAAIRQTRGHKKANNIFIPVAIYDGGGDSYVEKDDPSARV